MIDQYLFNGEIVTIRNRAPKEETSDLMQRCDTYLARAMKAEALLVALLEDLKVIYAIEDPKVLEAVEEWRNGK